MLRRSSYNSIYELRKRGLYVYAALSVDTLRELPRPARFCCFLRPGKAASTNFRHAALSTLREKYSSPDAKLLERRGLVCMDEKSEPDAAVDDVLLNPSKEPLSTCVSVAADAKILKSPDA